MTVFPQDFFKCQKLGLFNKYFFIVTLLDCYQKEKTFYPHFVIFIFVYVHCKQYATVILLEFVNV